MILKLHEQTDLTKGTTVNVGLVRGGTRTNVTAGKATAEVDIRVSSEPEVHRINAFLDGLRPEIRALA